MVVDPFLYNTDQPDTDKNNDDADKDPGSYGQNPAIGLVIKFVQIHGG